jgi:hypothetical protein
MAMIEIDVPAPEIQRPEFNTDWTAEERAQLTDTERMLLPLTILDGETREEQLAYLQRFAVYHELCRLETERATRISRAKGII